MKKSGPFIVYIALFFVLCLLPALGMAVFGPSPLLANESAPRTPALFSRDGTLNGDVLSDASNYAETRFAFRPQLVSARSFLYEKLLRSSAEPQVVLGKEGELFYASTLDDYSGIGLSDAELRQIASHLKEIQDSLEARGIRFVFAVAPNKNSLIPGAMPGRTERGPAFAACGETGSVLPDRLALDRGGRCPRGRYPALCPGP